MPFAWPGVTVVLPLSSPKPAGTGMMLGRIDPIAGLVAARDPNGNVIFGQVNADGMSATFDHVSRFSAVVGMAVQGVLGDVNGDGTVDCTDLNILKAAFGKRLGQPGYDFRADINRNQVVDVVDLATVSRQVELGRALRRSQKLEQENRRLRADGLPQMIAGSRAMEGVLRLMERTGTLAHPRDVLALDTARPL